MFYFPPNYIELFHLSLNNLNNCKYLQQHKHPHYDIPRGDYFNLYLAPGSQDAIKSECGKGELCQ